jgi:hypothetical protein
VSRSREAAAVSTTMNYIHVLDRRPGGVRNPADRIGLWPMLIGFRLRITTSGTGYPRSVYPERGAVGHRD